MDEGPEVLEDRDGKHSRSGQLLAECQQPDSACQKRECQDEDHPTGLRSVPHGQFLPLIGPVLLLEFHPMAVVLLLFGQPQDPVGGAGQGRLVGLERRRRW